MPNFIQFFLLAINHNGKYNSCGESCHFHPVKYKTSDWFGEASNLQMISEVRIVFSNFIVGPRLHYAFQKKDILSYSRYSQPFLGSLGPSYSWKLLYSKKLLWSIHRDVFVGNFQLTNGGSSARLLFGIWNGYFYREHVIDGDLITWATYWNPFSLMWWWFSR